MTHFRARGGSLRIRNGLVFDGSSEQLVDRDVVIVDGLILDADDAGPADLPEHATSMMAAE